MNAWYWRSLVAVASLLGLTWSAMAQTARERIPDIDLRTAVPEETWQQAGRPAMVQLQDRDPAVKVEFHPVTGSPSFISSRDGFLTAPGGAAKRSGTPVAGAFNGDTNRIAKLFVESNRSLFGHGAGALDSARVHRDFINHNSGLRTVTWQQQVAGIPVFEAIFVAHTTRDDELVNVASGFLPDPWAAASSAGGGVPMATPTVTAVSAIRTAAEGVGVELTLDSIVPAGAGSSGPERRQLFRAPGLQGETTAVLVWLPVSRAEMRLCWDIVLTTRARSEMFRCLVDAATGELWLRRGLTEYISDASYTVFTSDSPTPMSPGHLIPSNAAPLLVARQVMTVSALNTNASPLGWISDGDNETRGNNVDAHTDLNDDDLPDLPRPQGSPVRVFDFPMDLTFQSPSQYREAAVVQLFYVCNWVHDRLYDLGFTEAAGNFQNNNFGRGGIGNDAVQADAQDGGGVNNANFSTPPDGSPGRMQMYVFTGPNPDRDGDLDTEIVIHEYVHGLSNRRVGGGIGLSSLQSRGMGEGWSDFYGLALLSEPSDDPSGCYAAGAYASHQLSGLAQSYYFGIRRYPYTTDLSKNPLTFRDIDPVRARTHAGIPRSPNGGVSADEVHNMGEVWCVALWEARANLIQKHGWAAGNELILQLVTDGMNLSPPNPNFVQARDAILQAELIRTGGANRAELWRAFAKRGLGFSARSPSSSTTTGLSEAYDVPDSLSITPAALVVSGPLGGPFDLDLNWFALTNTGDAALTWQLGPLSPWITVTPAGGTLNPAQGTLVTISLDPAVTNFGLGITRATLWFTNLSTAVTHQREFQLQVVGRSMFDDFDPGVDVGLWAAFGGTLGVSVDATNYGGSVSAPNALWFGGATSRFAATVPLDTTQGGTVGFSIRLADGAGEPWETVDSVGEEVVLEFSTNGVSWTQMQRFAIFDTYAWRTFLLPIPPEATSASTQFRWRQLSHSGACCDHWAIDNVTIDSGPTSPTVVEHPRSRTVPTGLTIQFEVMCVGSTPLSYQWKHNNTNLLGETNSILIISAAELSDAGEYCVAITNAVGGVLSSNALLTVLDLGPAEDFWVVGLYASNSVVAEHGSLTGDDRGGIAISPSHVFYTGDHATARFSIDSPNMGTVVPGVRRESLVSDLKSGQIYALGNGITELGFGGLVTTLIPLDPVTLAAGTPIVLSETIQMQSGGIFAGFGRVVLWNGSRVYDIRVPSGVVIDCGPATLPLYQSTESWAIWGIAEWSGTLSLVYVQNSQTIVRTRIPDGLTTTVASFSNLSDMACITAAPLRDRWYFHHEGWSQFGSFDEAVGFASAQFAFNLTNPPVLLSQPAATHVVKPQTSVTFSVIAQGASPLHYQWMRDGVALSNSGRISGVNEPALTLLSTLESDTGVYSLRVTNRYGSTFSSNAVLRVTPLDHFSFLPIGTNQIAGTPFAATIIARDSVGGSVTNHVEPVTLRASSASQLGGIVQVLAFNLYADKTVGGEYQHTLSVISNTFPHFAVTTLSNTTASALLAALSGKQVFLIPEQEAAPFGVLQQLGTEWSAVLDAFVRGGGIVIVCSHHHEEPDILTASGLMTVQRTGFVASDIVTADTSHFLTTNLPATFAAYDLAHFSTLGNGRALVSGVSGAPVVLVRDIGGGHAVLIGCDYYTVGTPMDTLLANAVRRGRDVRSGFFRMEPETTGSFTNGVWTGHVTIHDFGTNVVILADDTEGHLGFSNPFDVTLRDDLSLTFETDSGSLLPGATTIMRAVVANSGPAVSTGVLVTNSLPWNGSLSSVVVSQGSHFVVGTNVVWDVGTLSGGTNATIGFVLTAVDAGEGWIHSTVKRSEPESYLTNNVAQASFEVVLPVIAVRDISIMEGNAGTVAAQFAVELTPAAILPVTFQFRTADGSATAGLDYIAASGNLELLPGQTNAQITVHVRGDTVQESDEIFFLHLDSPTNATLFSNQVTGVILNDELPSAAYVRSSTSQPWGSSANEQAMTRVFGVSNWLDLRFETADLGTLFWPAMRFIYLEGSDGTANELEGFLNLNRSLVESWVSNGGCLFINAAPNEGDGMNFGFGVSLLYSGSTTTAGSADNSHPVFAGPFTPVGTAWSGNGFAHATVTGSGLTAVITNQNGQMVLGEMAVGAGSVLFGGMTTDNFHSPQPEASNLRANIIAYLESQAFRRQFAWAEILSPQRINQPFHISISTRDAMGNPATNFSGTAVFSAMSGSNSVLINPTLSTPFTNGVWAGELTVLEPAKNVVLAANAPRITGSSLPFQVLVENDLAVSVTVETNPVPAGAEIVFHILVENSGPSNSTGVVLTNLLPADANYVFVTASQGTWAQTGPTVTAELGTIIGGSNAWLTVVALPTLSGVTMDNVAGVRRNEAEEFSGNNIVTTHLTVREPTLVVDSVAVSEGNTGRTAAEFQFRLSAPSAKLVAVRFSTLGANATSGIDYLATNGIFVLLPGQTSGSVPIYIVGDITIETDETFTLQLSSPTNCILSQAFGTGTILNDDGVPGQIHTVHWQPISVLQFAGTFFPASLVVRDGYGAVASNFNGDLHLSANLSATSNSLPLIPLVAAVTNGVWSGEIAVLSPGTNVVLQASDGDGHVGVSIPFQVVGSNQPPFIVNQPVNTSGFLNGNASFEVSAYASPPWEYEWRKDGALIPGATNATLQLGPLRVEDGGSYSVVVRNGWGSASSAKATLQIKSVVAWGAGTNYSQQPHYGQSQVPPGLSNVVAVAGGTFHSLALSSEGRVTAWGATNQFGSHPNYGQSSVPSLGNVVAIAAGAYHSLALRNDGTVAAWGAGTNAQLFSSPHLLQSIVPAFVSNIVSIAAGDLHSVALRRDGQVLVWGNAASLTTVPAAARSNVVAIAAAGNYVLALRSDGVVVRWGSGGPVPSISSNVVDIAAGMSSGLLLRADGTVQGIGTLIPSGLSNIVDIAAGAHHFLAVTRNGHVVTWGSTNVYGLHAIPTGLTNVVGIGAGSLHSLACLGSGLPLIKHSPISRTIGGNTSTDLSVLAVGPGLRYQWRLNGIELNNSTNSVHPIRGAMSQHHGDYDVVVWNDSGAVTSAVARVIVALPLSLALDFGGNWSAGGHVPWYGQTQVSSDSVDAAQSGAVEHSQQSTLGAQTSGPARVKFVWRTSSEEFFDTLTFYAGGVMQDRISGETGWRTNAVDLGAGLHSLSWVYSKDASVSAGLDAAWLDQVEITALPPIITTQPISRTNEQGSVASFEAFASGLGSVTYQWIHDGTNLPGELGTTLMLTNVNRRHGGIYQLVASNASGASASSNAFLKVLTPQVIVQAGMNETGFYLLSGDRGGGALTDADLSGFELQYSTNLLDWVPLEASITVTNGQLLLREIGSEVEPQRFYRVTEH